MLQSIHAEPLKECITCRGPVEKLISISSFQFKGNGWYITDYKNKENKKNGNTKKNVNNDSENKSDEKKDKANVK